jgi:hypothetical protein
LERREGRKELDTEWVPRTEVHSVKGLSRLIGHARTDCWLQKSCARQKWPDQHFLWAGTDWEPLGIAPPPPNVMVDPEGAAAGVSAPYALRRRLSLQGTCAIPHGCHTWVI